MLLQNLPIVLFCIVPLTLVVTFSLSIYYEHVTYWVPYISDSGTFAPESCIFGQMLNVAALLMFAVIYVKYLSVKDVFVKGDHSARDHRLNLIGLHVGLVSALGCSLVANFQETTMFTVHWIGAILVFGCGSAYQCLQTALYLKMAKNGNYKWRKAIKAILAVISSGSVVIFIITGLVANSQFTGTEPTKWRKEDGGFEIHVVSAITEWICAICTMFYILTFVWDFRHARLSEPELFICDNNVVALTACESGIK